MSHNRWHFSYQTRAQQQMADTNSPDAWTWVGSEQPFTSLDGVKSQIEALNADERPSCYIRDMDSGEMKSLVEFPELAGLAQARAGEQMEGVVAQNLIDSVVLGLSLNRSGRLVSTPESPIEQPFSQHFSIGQKIQVRVISANASSEIQVGLWEPLPEKARPSGPPSLPLQFLKSMAPAAGQSQTAGVTASTGSQAALATATAKRTLLESFETGKITLEDVEPGELHLVKVLSASDGKVSFLLPTGEQSEMADLPTKGLNEGDCVYVKITEVDKAQRTLSFEHATTYWSIMHLLFPKGQQIEAAILQLTPQGVVVQVDDEYETFVPLAELNWDALSPVEKTRRFTPGQTISFWVAGVSGHRLALTLRKHKVLPIQADDVLTGNIEKIGKYGVFVRFDDKQKRGGNVSNAEMSHSRKVTHPNECFIFQENTPLTVKVRGVSWDGKLQLSLKGLHPDPWLDLEQRYQLEKDINVRFAWWLHPTDKGQGFQVFLEHDVPGYINDTFFIKEQESLALYKSLTFQPGETLKARIKDIDADNKRVFLSMLEAQPELLTKQRSLLNDRFRPGSLVMGQVASCEELAAQVRIDGLSSSVKLPRDAAADFLKKGEGLTQILTPERSIVLEVIETQLSEQVELSVKLKGLGPA